MNSVTWFPWKEMAEEELRLGSLHELRLVEQSWGQRRKTDCYSNKVDVNWVYYWPESVCDGLCCCCDCRRLFATTVEVRSYVRPAGSSLTPPDNNEQLKWRQNTLFELKEERVRRRNACKPPEWTRTFRHEVRTHTCTVVLRFCRNTSFVCVCRDLLLTQGVQPVAFSCLSMRSYLSKDLPVNFRSEPGPSNSK